MTTIIEQSADGWSYVYDDDDDGVFGWVATTDLTLAPNEDVGYRVQPADGPDLSNITVAYGRDLLMLPETLGISVPNATTLMLTTAAPVPTILDSLAQGAFRAYRRANYKRTIFHNLIRGLRDDLILAWNKLTGRVNYDPDDPSRPSFFSSAPLTTPMPRSTRKAVNFSPSTFAKIVKRSGSRRW